MIALTFPAGAGRSSAMDINDLEQVVGHVVIDGRAHAFVWTLATGMVDIGGLPGSVHSYATAINNAGQVAGYSVDDRYQSHAFRWSPSEGVVRLPMPPGTVHSDASGINASGEVVGGRGSNSVQVAFRWSREKGTEDLASSETSDRALAIADNGDVVGYSLEWEWGGFSSAVLWTAGGTKTILDTCDLAPNPYCAIASSINSAGQIAGTSYDRYSSSLAYRLTVGADRQNITGAPGSNSSEASAINEAGQVVGRSMGPAYPLWHAFLWSPIGGAIDLGALPGRQGSRAYGINNRGQVVGSSY
ncbi:MAG: hypothetical protein ABIR58_06240 [Gemmatimonadaceae bacterium]